MREGWRELRLGEVVSRRSDFTSVTADALYRVVGVQRSGWGLVNREPMRGDSMKFEKLMELHANNLVYRTITAFEAPSTVVRPEFEGNFVTPQTFPVYSIDRAQLLPEYMALLTTSPAFHEEMSSRCVGTVLRRKTLSKSAFESIPLVLPPLVAQRRIVDLIAAVDDAIEAAKDDAHALDRAICRLRIVRSEAPMKPLGELLSGIDSGLSVASSANETTGPKLLRISAVRHGMFDLGEFKHVGTAQLPERARLYEGDLLMTRSNTPERVGYVAIAEGIDSDYFFPDLVWRLVPKKEEVDTRYLMEILSSEYGRSEIMARASGTSASMQKVSKARIATVPVPVPSLDEQSAYVAPIRSAQESLLAVQAQAEALRTLRSNLLTVLLSGEHEIPSSYDQLLTLDEENAA